MNLVLGTAINFSGFTLPFSVGDLVSTGSALLGPVGQFVLFGLAIVLVNKLIPLITEAISPGSHADRDEYGNRIR